MPQTVIISYRGANYAIGQGQLYYGIWPAGSPDGNPIEWWQHTPEGWAAAWARFTALEVPGTIAPVSAPPVSAPPVSAPPAGAPAGAPGPAVTGPATAAASMPDFSAVTATTADAAAASTPVSRAVTVRSRIGAGLLALGVVAGIAGLFPVYLDGASLSSTAADLVPHVIYLAAWSLSAVLILMGGARRQAGALIGAGTSVVTFGLFVADAGTPISGGSHLMGAGLVLGILGWVACTAGIAVTLPGLALRQAVAGRRSATATDAYGRGVPAGYGPPQRRASRFSSPEIVPMVTLMLAALGAAIAFAPSWDSFTLHTTAGALQTITEGNAFSNPAAVIAGDVLVMAGFFAVIVVAAFWRPIRLGAALVAGAAIPMVAQAISALVQIATPATPAQFGISQAQASAAGLTISSGLTAMFWVYCAFLATIIMLGVWMVLAPAQAPVSRADSYPAHWSQAGWTGTGPVGTAPGAASAAATDTLPAGQPAPSGQADLAPPGGRPGQTEVIPGLRPAP